MSSNIAAGTSQIDMLGLIPGTSSPEQVAAVSSTSGRLQIGGHSLDCSTEFIDNKLSLVVCLTGKDYSAATNDDVHRDLVIGFTKKFGKPDTDKDFPVRTRNGVTYQQNMVSWTDQGGNTLSLMSMFSRIDQGGLSMRSAIHIKNVAEKNAAEERAKKF